MSLTATQFEFTKCIGLLIHYTYTKNYRLTMSDAYRDPRVHGKFGEKKAYSAAKSCHKVRLAMDFNLFVNCKYISDGDHPAYKELGEFWKTLHPLARWGGDFQDANHFSFEYQGRK